MRARRPEIGRWFFHLSFARVDHTRFDPFTRVLEVTLVRLKHKLPEHAEPVAGKDYAGFRFRLVYRIPFYVRSWR